MKYNYFLFATALLICGCAPLDPYYAPTAGSAPIDESGQAQPREPIQPTERSAAVSTTAVRELLVQAKNLHMAGSYQRSLAVAERALRLDRHEPDIYLLLAANYVALEDYSQATQLIGQGLSLTRGDTRLESHFRLLQEQIHVRSQD